jgi:hypothetical protein
VAEWKILFASSNAASLLGDEARAGLIENAMERVRILADSNRDERIRQKFLASNLFCRFR